MAKRTKKKVQAPSSGYMLDINEATVDTSLNSYCQAYGIIQEELTQRELEWLCFVMTAYSWTLAQKEKGC